MEQSDIDKLTKALLHFAPVTARNDYGWPHPPLNVLDCILSLHRRYKTTVLPRVERFAKNHPDIVELHQLRDLINRYESPDQFSIYELDYYDAQRAMTLQGVVDVLIEIQPLYQGDTERQRLHTWAIQSKPKEVHLFGVKGFGLAGFQYLCMLFGAQTTKPDTHIRTFVTVVLGHKVGDFKMLELLEEAARCANLPLREVDHAIWELLSCKDATS